jgi:predicted acetyltransferase
MAKLVKPSIAYQTSFVEAVREFQAEGRQVYMGLDVDALERDFAAYVAELHKRETTPPQPGWVLDTILWLVDGDRFIGRISLRHRLTENLRRYGGHIGYEIRPTQRRKGYGTEMLRLALPIVRDLGITKALVTCDTTNVGSRKIIEANGGVLQDIIQTEFSKAPTMRWWIDLSE